MKSITKTFLVAELMILVLCSFFGQHIASASIGDIQFALSMPKEYINYNIAWSNGSLWAKIDGKYPIFNSGFDTLPIVYPTPPGTTNISIKLDGTFVPWTDYTEELHYTGIGNWSAIYAVLTDVPEFFVLEIHYEHPVQVINGSYMFLYDLNIKDYLSPYANKSVAHFTVNMDLNYTSLKVQTIGLDNSLRSVNYTINNENPKQITVNMVSEYGRLLGDLLFTFEAVDSEQISDKVTLSELVTGIVIGVGIATALLITIILVLILIIRYDKRRVEKNS